MAHVERGGARRKVPRRVGASGLVLVTVWLLLFAAVAAGLRVSPQEDLAGYPAAASVDLSRPAGGFVPLAERFIERVLGIIPPSSLSGGGALPARDLARGGGTAEARVSVTHPFTNDDFAHAFVVSNVPFTGRTDTRAATREPGEPSSCAAAGGTAWYRYTATENEGLLASTVGTDYVDALGVFDGTQLSDLRPIGCNTSPAGDATVGFAGKAGHTYYFQIAALAGGGDLVFDLDHLGTTDRVSVSSAGAQGNGDSTNISSVSADGRYVAFASTASNLAPTAPTCASGSCANVFLRDRLLGRTSLMTLTAAGAPSLLTGQYTGFPSISADGRFVAFQSEAADLVPGDTNGVPDIFVRDVVAGVTRRVSVASDGAEALPGGGAASGDPGSQLASISADGRYIAFQSDALNLVQGDTNGKLDVFIHDQLTGITSRVSVSSSGRQGDDDSTYPAISADGRYVVFRSFASDLTGRIICAPATACHAQIYRHDRLTGITELVSIAADGTPSDGDADAPAVSGDGRFVVFRSTASNLGGDPHANTYVRDMVLGTTVALPVGTPLPVAGATDSSRLDIASKYFDSISSDGRVIAYIGSLSSTLAVLVYDRVTGAMLRADTSSAGDTGNGPAETPALSADGRSVVFASLASNLVPDDSNGLTDIFVHTFPEVP